MKRALVCSVALLMPMVSAHAGNPGKVTLDSDCGKGATLMPGSTAYSGGAVLGTHLQATGHLKSCTIQFTPSPFNQGTRPYFIAPQCTVTGTTQRVLYTIAITAGTVKLSFDDFLPPPKSFQWTCAYPN